MLKLLREINVGSKNVDEIKSAFESFAKTGLKLEDFKLAKITREANGTIQLGNRTTRQAINLMKFGEFEKIIPHIFGIKNLPTPMMLKLSKEVEHMPQFHLGLHNTSVGKMKTIAKKELELVKFDGAANIVEKDLEASTKMSAIVNYMKDKTFKSLTLKKIFIGTTAFAIVNYVNDHRDAMSGCIRYEMIDGELNSCRLIERSCKNGKLLTDYNKSSCKTKDEFLMPLSDINLDVGCSGIVNGCLNCKKKNGMSPVTDDTKGNLPQDKLDDALEDEDDNADDTVYYTCKSPSFMEALADITHSQIDTITDFLVDKGRKLNSIINIVLSFLKYSLIVGGILTIIFAIFYTYQKIKLLKYKGGGQIIDEEEYLLPPDEM